MKTKKILSVLLTILMVVGIMPISMLSASADSYTATFKCLNILTDFGISTGNTVKIFIIGNAYGTVDYLTAAVKSQTEGGADLTGSITSGTSGKVKFQISGNIETSSASITVAAVILTGTGYAILTKNFTLGKNNTNLTFSAPSSITNYPVYYSITNDTQITDKGANGGYIEIDKESAEENDNVAVTVVPNDNYELDTLTYTPEDESSVDIKAEKSFTMPAKAVTVSATFTKSVVIPEAIADATYYASLSLNDNINLNFKVKDDDIDNGKLSVISGGVTYSVENGNMTATDDGVTMCIATKALAEMGEKVEIKVVYDSVDVKTYSISIADYCNYVAENGLTANEKAVASSLLKAGAYAQKLFNVDTDNLVTTVDSTTSADYSNVGEKIFNASSGITAVDASMSMTFSEGNSGAVDMVFTFTSLTLLSKSDFTVKNSKNEVLDNSSYTFDSSTNKLTIKNISSSRMAEQFTVTVNGASVTYGLYNYCKDVQGNANADLVNFANAIYAYGQAANTCYAK